MISRLRAQLAFARRLFTSRRAWSELVTHLRFGDRLHQGHSQTFANRYPRLFAEARDLLADRPRPHILSFGCSSGEEVLSLQSWFPDGTWVGAELNPALLRACQALPPVAGRTFIASSRSQILAHGPYDAIFCMAVFTRRPHEIERRGLRNIRSIYPFDLFAAEIRFLVSQLREGGLLIVEHALYRVEDVIDDQPIEPVRGASAYPPKSPVFAPDGSRIDPAPILSRVFRKTATAPPPTLPSHRRLRMALARKAYDSRTVRIANRDASGFSHLVTTRQGLFAANAGGLRLIAHGLFFGLTVHRDSVIAFEACGEPRDRDRRGRIIRLRLNDRRIEGADILAAGLDNGCHGIDVIGDEICITDTYNQKILTLPIDGGEVRQFSPMTEAADGDWNGGYAHINAVIASGQNRLLLLHNGADRTGRPSEIAIADRDWRVLRRIPLAGRGCHNLAILEDGTLLTCGSFAGELIGSNGFVIKISDLMTRGLSVGQDQIVVGGSTFSERDLRDDSPGELYFLDRDYRLQATVPMLAPPMDIRRIDGQDFASSTYLKQRGVVTRWPDGGSDA